ncbi:helix-turn-helix transcriptional regulator [Ihubacter massiliensis]|uniref:Helix-turn-helix transcriptional regulator n=1 Tax=Hominibacterium faecale TaxID=2839743 RepID=A0A9J6QSI7_9FIRM|nr:MULTISPECIES: helix-turn-helix transcriptional regulator [Eubacteriales Family XIII. Incertae Sedis]MCI7301454.1 helix-turn-helix transcriptional regulator [Clostridia bacterium]MCO7123155.1 helix-turn-helix transcriptional regulator [Ihubacter massiliensis]MCU7377415.1 helix-turn-helix transcriptional regulator [Hominibacterium faecale]MDY3009918.1 helix-turn-helix transcriptional regulator [Clostridiales Family XIII bacterium]
MIQTKKVSWIQGTPLGLSIYSANSLSTQLQEGVLEIIMCIKGSIRFSYAYEEFTLHQGEFISVDRDAYYLAEGDGSICVSFYIDLDPFYEKYPATRNSMFVCEGLKESEQPYPTKAHLELQGLLLGILIYLNEENQPDLEVVNRATDKIMQMMVREFDILFYLVSREQLSEKYIERYHEISVFLWKRLHEPVTLQDLAKEFHLTESYVSEFIRKSGLSFKKMVAYNRANASEKMLLTTDKSIAQVAEAYGFSDVKLYYAAFKRWYRCTPKQFRDKYKYGVQDDLEYVEIRDIKDDVMQISMQNHRTKLFL